MDGIPQSGSYTLSQHVFQIFPTVILRCVTPQKAGDSMNIGIVGAGKVGFSFGRLLAEKGMRISGYYSRNPTAQEKPQNLQIPDTIPTWANSSKIVTRFSSPFRIMRSPRCIGRSQNLKFRTSIYVIAAAPAQPRKPFRVFTRREPMQYPFICYFRSAASITAGGSWQVLFLRRG